LGIALGCDHCLHTSWFSLSKPSAKR
jgi:hypothetical protein